MNTETNKGTQMTSSMVISPLIEGKLPPSISEKTFDVINPSTGQILHSVSVGSEEDVDRAVASARTAFDDGRWCDASPSFRKKTLHRFADLIAAEASQLDALDAEEMGKPVSLAFANAAGASEMVRFFAEAVDKVSGEVFSSDNPSLVIQRKVPRGIVAAVVPWNFPTVNSAFKVASALAAGNCLVLKPSELASRSAMRLAQLALEAGLPAGVFNVVPGTGQIVGRALALHRDVDMLTFTGSTTVGKLMLQYAGQSNMKTIIAECGGKSPQIVFADGVDLDAAADNIAQMILINQGQLCTASSRLLVQQEIEGELIDKVASRFKKIVAGNSLDANTTFGPLVSAQQCEKVMDYIKTGQQQGGELVIGGGRLLEDSGGFFVEPTLIRNVQPDAVIAQEEIFGPVLSVTSFKDEAQAIQLANSTQYGLAAYVWTASLITGMNMAKGIRSSVSINATASTGEGGGCAVSVEPFGQSGVGTEGGLAGLESYLHRQHVSFNHG